MRKIKIIGTRNLEIIKKFTLTFIWKFNIPRGTLKISIYDNSSGIILAENFVPFEVQVPAFSNIRINGDYQGTNTLLQIAVMRRDFDMVGGDTVRIYTSLNIPSFSVDEDYILEYYYY
jgi:hypothetical protein